MNADPPFAQSESRKGGMDASTTEHGLCQSTRRDVNLQSSASSCCMYFSLRTRQEACRGDTNCPATFTGRSGCSSRAISVTLRISSTRQVDVPGRRKRGAWFRPVQEVVRRLLAPTLFPPSFSPSRTTGEGRRSTAGFRGAGWSSASALPCLLSLSMTRACRFGMRRSASRPGAPSLWISAAAARVSTARCWSRSAPSLRATCSASATRSSCTPFPPR